MRLIQEHNKTGVRIIKTLARQPTLTLDEAMNDDVVVSCLQMGLPVERIRNLVKRKLETTGTFYSTPQSLAEAVLDDQIEAECDDDDRPMRSTVTNLLYSAIAASTSTSPQPQQVTVNRVETSVDENDVKSPTDISKNSNRNAKELEEENKRLREARECKICFTDEIGVVFVPCGHLGEFQLA